MSKTEIKKKTTGRKCSICSHAEVKKINSLINEGKSLRSISLNFGMSDVSLHRHVQNHLNLEIRALIRQHKIKNAIDHYQEIAEQLEFARDLRIAAKEYLSDETGKLVLFPRSDEVSVVYEDYSDCTPKGDPKKKTDSLDTLLERAEKGNAAPVKTIIKHVDIRSFALDAIKTVDIVLDKIARKEGLYLKERENDDALSQLKAVIESEASKKGVSYREELQYYLGLFSGKIKPEIEERLISELNN